MSLLASEWVSVGERPKSILQVQSFRAVSVVRLAHNREGRQGGLKITSTISNGNILTRKAEFRHPIMGEQRGLYQARRRDRSSSRRDNTPLVRFPGVEEWRIWANLPWEGKAKFKEVRIREEERGQFQTAGKSCGDEVCGKEKALLRDR